MNKIFPLRVKKTFFFCHKKNIYILGLTNIYLDFRFEGMRFWGWNLELFFFKQNFNFRNCFKMNFRISK